MENSSNDLQNIINGILLDYASSYHVEPFDGSVIITDNLTETYKETRHDLFEKGKINVNEIEKYHGLTVQPIDKSGKFTILINKKYVLESITNNNVDWLGTLVHEATHVNDFKDYYEIINPESFDELYEYDLHRIFLYWTEFHARAIGHYFLRKYTLVNFKDESHIEYILQTELPFHINYLVQEMKSTQDADRQMYVTMHFLGRLAVWQYLYPKTFDAEFIEEITNSNPWMKEIYDILLEYKTLEEIYPHFNEIEEILNNYFS